MKKDKSIHSRDILWYFTKKEGSDLFPCYSTKNIRRTAWLGFCFREQYNITFNNLIIRPS